MRKTCPPRKDPAEYLRASFTTQSRLIALDEYNIRQPRMVLRISIRNLYDEVLQDTARVRKDSIFWKFGRYTKKVDNQGIPYLESDSLYFVAEGRIQLFRHGPAIKAPKLIFGIIYKLIGFGTIPE